MGKGEKVKVTRLKTSIVLDRELRRRANVRAAEEERGLSDLIAELLEKYLQTPLKSRKT
jgi:hypothetical protein